MFIAIDGDDVGAEIEKLIYLCQAEELEHYCENVSRVMTILTTRLRQTGARLLLTGGDNVLAELDKAPSPGLIHELFSDTLPISVSVGTGRTMLEAHIALKTAKASGKKCWVEYNDLSSARRLQYDRSYTPDSR